MFRDGLIKRSVVGGLAIGALSLPAVAQARPTAEAVTSVGPVLSTAAVQRQLAPLHADGQQRFASEQDWPSVVSSVSPGRRRRGEFGGVMPGSAPPA
jgi:hypothetical protein